ncbi:MAG: sensor histidine kinase [Phocaeicola sp.]|uniref:sensor histidine kinase n=1 Tax=Phocaeicola TaxID=909656 RepID=UPI00234F0EB6|nr:HAMP domain-containing sensor histidine kinase [Phocaeicola oris]MCE2615436.1 HAMP domain-containing histidine kinase [Phocaeicola oris]
MHIPFKHIIFLAVFALTCIFSYQTHWLLGVYHSQKEEVELHIVDAMIAADITEMMIRVDTLQKDSSRNGQITISSGFDNKTDTSYTRVQTFYHSKDSTLYSTRKSIIYNKEFNVQNGDTTQAKVHAIAITSKPDDKNFSLNMSDFAHLATSIQRAMHSGLDNITKLNIAVYDSILDKQLYQYNIYKPHKIELIHYEDSLLEKYSVIAETSTHGYHPSTKAQRFKYYADVDSQLAYQIQMEPITFEVLKQMKGMLVASAFTLLILLFTYIYLIRTLWKQKTLDEMKSDFTNNITHELKTPIAIAYAANDAMLNFNTITNPDKAKEYLNISQEQLQRLSGMVEQILSMSMEQRKTLELHKESIGIKDMLDPLVAQLKLKAEKPLDITLSVDPEELMVNVDRIHFYNIISNLIDNAIKYSKETVKIDILCRKNKVGGVCITVKDNGIGIPQDKLKYIFDKFYRVSNGNRYDVKGYGLGLYYVKYMTEKHGGTIDVQSTVNVGTKFVIQFN